MITLIHLSDLHVGKVNEKVKQSLLRDLKHEKPSLIVISGDSVQGESERYFRAACELIEQFPSPTFIVPGNHDIPSYNLARRFYDPFRNYHKYLCRSLSPIYEHEPVVVIGLSSVHAWRLNFVDGTLYPKQLRYLRETLKRYSSDWLKIVVFHHPCVIPPENKRKKFLIKRYRRILDCLFENKVDLVLSGHFHHHCIIDAAEYHGVPERSLLVSIVSTTISTRIRHYPNSYTLIALNSSEIRFQPRVWDTEKFEPQTQEVYQKVNSHWRKRD